MTDELFLATIVLFALVTPSGRYKHINIALAAKFAVFIGVHHYLTEKGLGDGPVVDYYRAVLDLFSLFLFLYFKGYYLASICFFMVIFHLSNATVQLEEYTSIMITFQVAQLMGAIWGALDGMDRISLRSIWSFTHHSNHNKL